MLIFFGIYFYIVTNLQSAGIGVQGKSTEKKKKMTNITGVANVLPPTSHKFPP